MRRPLARDRGRRLLPAADDRRFIGDDTPTENRSSLVDFQTCFYQAHHWGGRSLTSKLFREFDPEALNVDIVVLYRTPLTLHTDTKFTIFILQYHTGI